VGIFNALKNVNPVKKIIPVFFFSINELTSAGGRGGTFVKNIEQIFLKIFKDGKFEENKSEILFFFTIGYS
jgi:hypothetical protein